MLVWFLIITHIPVLLALIVAVKHYGQINPLWIALLVLSIFTGGAPLLALVFLFFTRKKLGVPSPPNTAELPAPQPGVNPGTIPAQSASSASINRRAAGTALGTIVGIVLWTSGLLLVGFFVVATLAVIQCANDPKCM
jgi:hypothetical protein